MLPHPANPLLLNAVNFSSGKDNPVIDTIFGFLNSDPKHVPHAMLFLMVLELIAAKIYKAMKSGNAVRLVS